MRLFAIQMADPPTSAISYDNPPSKMAPDNREFADVRADVNGHPPGIAQRPNHSHLVIGLSKPGQDPEFAPPEPARGDGLRQRRKPSFGGAVAACRPQHYYENVTPPLSRAMSNCMCCCGVVAQVRR